MSAESLIVECDGPVWQLTFNRPQQGNACSAELVAALDNALQRAEREYARAVVLRGAGRHFCTGFDLSGIGQESDDTLLARFVRIELVLQRLARAPFLTVAVVQGRAIGAGADIFTACELRCMQGEASFAFPGARGFGLVLGTRRLCEAVGRSAALDWIESGRTIDAGEALRAGLVTHALQPEVTIEAIVGARLGADLMTSAALRSAAGPQRESEYAADLYQLVQSAAVRGLRDRVADYIERAKARKLSPSLHQQNT